MEQIRYYDGKRIRRLDVQGAYEAPQRRPRASRQQAFVHTASFTAMRPQLVGEQLIGTLYGEAQQLKTRFRAFSEARTVVAPVGPGETTVVPTETVALDHPRKTDLRWLRSKYGMVTVEEGSHGKVLMRVPDEAEQPVQYAAEAALALHTERPGPASAHPNFIRMVQRPSLPSATAEPTQWALDNTGATGVPNADVHAHAAWTISRGDPGIRVAVLDEGVDTAHPFLAAAVEAERDFFAGNPTAAPAGDDAHGTACAGIVASRDANVSGLAPEISLVAARIAKSDALGFWIFDDFQTADAIDWCWDEARADVLSNSWGGGPPAPVITRAFERARINGRKGLGAVVVVAAGNEQGPIGFPGDLANVLTIGASNQWDKRKTKSSKDGENWWGSNYGRALDLMAPGVKISTTDISGPRGYSTAETTDSFNCTSSSTPFVAAAAGLMLSTRPALTEARVRKLLQRTAKPMSSGGGRSTRTGFGRLDAYAAVRAARAV